MANLFSYRPTLKKLHSLKIDWKAGITVQVLAPDPYNPTAFRWVYNKLETELTKLAQYNYQPKPAGWGNGGGGLERLKYVPRLDRYLTELEILEMRRPGHSILTDESLSEEAKIILAGGLREFVDETGFRDIEIKTDYPGFFLSEYKYPPWIDAKGIIHPGGHRKITLWGVLSSYREDPIVEFQEIGRTNWFDLSESLYKQFFNISPERPYWSHVLCTLGSVLRVYRHERETKDNPVLNIPRRIHPSWWDIRQIGRGDSRFPERGYKLSPRQWNNLFTLIVANRMEEADNDFLLKFLGWKELDNAKSKEEEMLSNLETKDVEGESATPEVTRALEGSEDSEGIPTVEDMLRVYEEEYVRWFENN